jgi:hypothetical protein
MSPRGARTYGDRFLKGEDCFMTITQFPSGDVKQTASGADLTGDPDTAADAFNAMHDAARNPESPGQTGAQTGRSLNIGGGPSNPGAPGGSQPGNAMANGTETSPATSQGKGDAAAGASGGSASAPAPRPSAPQAAPTFGNISKRQPEAGQGRVELSRVGGKWYEMGSGGANTLATGDYNYAVQDGRIYASRYGDLEAAKGQRVTYAGGIHFGQDGALATWDNASDSFKPASEFAKQAGLPMDKFTPALNPGAKLSARIPTSYKKGGEVAQVLKTLGVGENDLPAFSRGEKIWVIKNKDGVRVTFRLQLVNDTLTASMLSIKNLAKAEPGTSRPKPSIATARSIKAFLDQSRELGVQLGAKKLRHEWIAVVDPKLEAMLKRTGYAVDPNNQGVIVRETAIDAPRPKKSVQVPTVQNAPAPRRSSGGSAPTSGKPRGSAGAASGSAPSTPPKPLSTAPETTTHLTKGRVTVEYTPGSTDPKSVKVKSIDVSIASDKAGGVSKYFKNRPMLRALGSQALNGAADYAKGKMLEDVESHYASALEAAHAEFQSEFPDASSVSQSAKLKQSRDAYQTTLAKLKAPDNARTFAMVMTALTSSGEDRDARLGAVEDHFAKLGGRPEAIGQFIEARKAYEADLAEAMGQLVKFSEPLGGMAEDIGQRGAVVQRAGADLHESFMSIMQSPAGMVPLVYYAALDIDNAGQVFERLGSQMLGFSGEMNSLASDYQQAWSSLNTEFMRLSDDMGKTERLLAGRDR